MNERPRSSHIKPSVAVRFFSFFSFSTSCSSVPQRAGAALYLVRTFCVPNEWRSLGHHRKRSCKLTLIFPLMSLCTGANAAEPRRSTWPIHYPGGDMQNEINGSLYVLAPQHRLTKQPQETLGCLEECQGVDASVGDRNICKRLP